MLDAATATFASQLVEALPQKVGVRFALAGTKAMHGVIKLALSLAMLGVGMLSLHDFAPPICATSVSQLAEALSQQNGGRFAFAETKAMHGVSRSTLTIAMHGVCNFAAPICATFASQLAKALPQKNGGRFVLAETKAMHGVS